MKNALISFIVGLIFAIGLGISGMTQPQKVIGFLDLFGNWDPSLIFVMGGAVAVHLVTYRLIRRQSHPLFDRQWHVPTKTEITPALMIGSIIFGIGWALGGFCPGPGITSMGSLEIKPVLFVISMLVGMWIFRIVDQKIHFKK